MLDRILSSEQLRGVVDRLMGERRVVGPVRRGDAFVYERVSHAEDLALGFSYCRYGPKQFLFPPTEVLFTFERTNGTFRARPVFERTPLALVGVHPCDIHAIRLLDKVFDDLHDDDHYFARRRSTLILGVDCARPCQPGVFCRDMHTNDAVDGFDLMLYPLNGAAAKCDRWGVVVGSEAGRGLLQQRGLGSAPKADDERALERYRADKTAAFPKTIPYDVDTLPGLLEHSYDSLLWEATARRCYSCGSCNLVCPTCYCFNMRDETALDGRQGARLREWDGCQLAGFALVAGGHNFRPKAAARLRHRVYRKGKWIRERTGLAGCVGCARCDRACTAKISIVEMYRQLAEER